MFYVRIAQRYPELFDLKYVLCRSAKKAERLRREGGLSAGGRIGGRVSDAAVPGSVEQARRDREDRKKTVEDGENVRKHRMRKANGAFFERLAVRTAAMLMGLVFVLFCGGREQTVQAAGRTVRIVSCGIEGAEVVCGIEADPVPSSDDKTFYLYADEVYEDGPAGEVVGKAAAGKTAEVRFPLDYDTDGSNLSRKFLVSMKRNGRMEQVSDEHYITNPEVLAPVAAERMDRGIKGILPTLEGVVSGELEELGIQQVIYNLYLDDICSDESVPDAIPFAYNGRTWYFDRDKIEYYDAMIRTYNAMDVQVTMVLLNRGEGEYSRDLVHPRAFGAACPGYALNVAQPEGTEHLKAIGAFLGRRYCDEEEHGQIDNWILGNEVNARTEWWYTDSSSLDFNSNIYVKAFRIIYNEMKASNASLRIYNSIDQEWNRKSNPGSFLARDYLDRFNYWIRREGNIDWGLSYHPYNSPLTDPYAWNGPARWVGSTLSTPYITMQNLDILIDYMHSPEFLNPNGEVRSISLAEVGYTSAYGEEKQAASVAYGYLKAASLPDVDAFMLFRMTDHEQEMQSKLNLGLKDINGNRKQAYEMYGKLGTPEDAAAKAMASEIIGMDIDEMIEKKIVWTREG